MSEKPITAFSGVRSSWLMRAIKFDFAAFASRSSLTRLFWSSSSTRSERLNLSICSTVRDMRQVTSISVAVTHSASTISPIFSIVGSLSSSESPTMI